MTAILKSFFRLPHWVKIWVALVLVPMNMGGLLFLDHRVGIWCAVLGLMGMAPNIVIMWSQKGLSKAMALPHIIPWTILVIWLLTLMTSPDAPTGPLGFFAWGLLATNSISLFFDYTDAYKWWQGDREIA